MKALMVLVTFLLACSTSTPKDKKIALEDWNGHTTEELMSHPYFRTLGLTKKSHKNGTETWIFRDQSRYQSSAYCQSLGGCMGIPIYQCDTAFSIEGNKILTAQQSGSCPPAKTIEVLKK